MLSSLTGYYITFCYKHYGLAKFSESDKYISNIGGLAAIGNGVSRLTLGILIETFGYRPCTVAVIAVETILIGTFYYLDSIYLFGVWIILLNFCGGGLVVCYLSLVLEKFGLERGTKTFPLINSSLIITFVIMYIFDNFLIEKLGYHNMFLLLTLLSSIAIILAYFLKAKNIK